MSKATLPTGQYVLKEHSQWPNWYIQLQFHALSKGIWKEIDPDEKEAVPVYSDAPTRPNRPTDTAQTEQYKMQLAEYRADTSNWASKATHLQHMWTWVNATVDPQLLAPAMMTLVEQKKLTLQALIKALRTELAPTSISTINLVRAQYRAHLQKAKQGRVNPESWYTKWHSLYAKAKAYKITDIDGLLAVQDFLDALAPKLSPEWAQTMHQSV
ncbi:hypothetical protein EJ02DRAFT_437090, partial [Clathrospora elynae]